MAVGSLGQERKGAARCAALRRVHEDLSAFRPRGFGPPVPGPPVDSRVLLLGQAPGPHEARLGRPFAWTAGKTLFRWLLLATGAEEALLRERVYISAVVRCFPGKDKSGGDRVPTAAECALWRPFLLREIAILRPRLLIPVGRLAIFEVLQAKAPLSSVVGQSFRRTFHGVSLDVIPLPHPSGASTWFKVEPGRSLLSRALGLLKEHQELRRALWEKR